MIDEAKLDSPPAGEGGHVLNEVDGEEQKLPREPQLQEHGQGDDQPPWTSSERRKMKAETTPRPRRCRTSILDVRAIAELRVRIQERAERITPVPGREYQEELLEQPSSRPASAERGLRRPVHRPHLTWPELDERPVSGFDRSRPLRSLAFPSLIPRSEADFAYPREREVS